MSNVEIPYLLLVPAIIELPGFWGVKNVSEINLGVPGQVLAIVVIVVMMKVVEHSVLIVKRRLQ